MDSSEVNSIEVNTSAVNSQEDAAELLQRLAQEICSRRLAAPAVFLLELYKPLTGLAHAATIAGLPFLGFLAGSVAADRVERLLSSRANIEKLMTLIEDGEKEMSAKAVGGT